MLFSAEAFFNHVVTEPPRNLEPAAEGIICVIHKMEKTTKRFLMSLSPDLTAYATVDLDSVDTIEVLATYDDAGSNFFLAQVVFKKSADHLANSLATLLATVDTDALISPDDPETLELPKTQKSAAQALFRKRSGWRPPWTWSKCAKCHIEVNLFLTGTLAAALSGAGPSAFAVAKALFEAKYGLAVWEAVKDYALSVPLDVLAKGVCRALGKCDGPRGEPPRLSPLALTGGTGSAGKTS